MDNDARRNYSSGSPQRVCMFVMGLVWKALSARRISKLCTVSKILSVFDDGEECIIPP